MKERALRVLLVEDELEEIRLVEEAFAELEEVQFSRTWLRTCIMSHAELIEDALDLIKQERFDVVLLDISLAGGNGAPAFRRIQEQDPDLAIVILTGAGEETQAISLVRQGAQDLVVKEEIDCIPLARTLRCAVERRHVRSALRSLSYVDDLTGLYSDGGFHKLAQSHCEIARGLNLKVTLHLIELEGLSRVRDALGRQETDLTLLRAAEILRNACTETDLIGRLSEGRFAVISFQDSRSGLKTADLTSRLQSAAAQDGEGSQLLVRAAAVTAPASGGYDALFTDAERSLCENRRSQTAVPSAPDR